MSTLIDLRTDVRANLASTHLARIEEFARCEYRESLSHTGDCSLEVAPDASFLAVARVGTVLRISETDRRQVLEYRIVQRGQGLSKQTAVLRAQPVIHDLNRYFLWESLGGIPSFVMGGSDLLAAEWIDNVVLPTLVSHGVTYVDRGTVDSTRRLNLEWDGQTVLWLLNQLIDGTDLDIVYRITNPGEPQERYVLELVRIGEEVPAPRIIVGESGVEALEWTEDGEPQANVVIPQGKVPTGGLEHSGIGDYVARVVSVEGNTLTLEDPDGNVAPVYAAEQVTGLYLELLVPPINTGALS